MKVMVMVTLLSLLTWGTAHAETIEFAALGSLELEFARVIAVNEYPGQPVAGKVTIRNGEAFSVLSPGRVQQIEYLVEPGESVTKGQPFAVLRGPEMHHLEMNYESSQNLATGAELRYKRNKPLHEGKAISESQWLEISENYYSSALEYEHMRHFFELVIKGDSDPDALTLAAPQSGVIDYRAVEGGLREGDSIALFIPPGAIRLELALPNMIATQVTAVRVGDCQFDIERMSLITEGFFVQGWTQSLAPECGLMLGQQVLALPLVRTENAYRVAKWSVFQMQQNNYVWIRSGSSLTAQAVTVLATEGEFYIVRADYALANAEVLTASVSAVKGVLLGLGEE